MNKVTRQEKLQQIISGSQQPVGRRTIRFRGESKEMDVYEIPINFLIYNKYNGRILSRTKTLETQGVIIDPETNDGKAVVEQLLWDSKPDKNRKTEKDLRQYGQQEVGIVTIDGIIVDGNRRAMLLNKIGATHFRAVILDVRLEEDQKEIERLETTYQMGADEKQDYNPIEKYLKINEMHNLGFSYQEIAECMGETQSQIEKNHKIYQTMVEYLQHIKCDGIFTALDGREDPLINLTDWNEKYSGGTSSTGFDGYSDADVDDMTLISFDYIRYMKAKPNADDGGPEGKAFRMIAGGNAGKNFFSDKEVWENFRDRHFENVQPITDSEPDMEKTSSNIEKEVKARDADWAMKVDSCMKENWGRTIEMLGLHQDKDRPGELLERARNALASIDLDNPNLSTSMIDIVKEINQKSYELKKKLEKMKD